MMFSFIPLAERWIAASGQADASLSAGVGASA
jgi:hypothetical protein